MRHIKIDDDDVQWRARIVFTYGDGHKLINCYGPYTIKGAATQVKNRKLAEERSRWALGWDRDSYWTRENGRVVSKLVSVEGFIDSGTVNWNAVD